MESFMPPFGRSPFAMPPSMMLQCGRPPRDLTKADPGAYPIYGIDGSISPFGLAVRLAIDMAQQCGAPSAYATLRAKLTAIASVAIEARYPQEEMRGRLEGGDYTITRSYVQLRDSDAVLVSDTLALGPDGAWDAKEMCPLLPGNEERRPVVEVPGAGDDIRAFIEAHRRVKALQEPDVIPRIVAALSQLSSLDELIQAYPRAEALLAGEQARLAETRSQRIKDARAALVLDD